MRQFVTLAFLALFVPASAEGRCSGDDLLSTLTEAETEALAAADEAPFGTGLLWQVSWEGRQSIIFGTVHIPGPDIDVPEQLLAALPSARNVWLETTNEDQTAFQTEMLTNASMFLNFSGPDLSSHFSASEWEVLSAALAESGMPAQMQDRLRPWFANLVLMVPPCAARAAMSGTPGLDRAIEERAIAAGRQVSGLETTKEVVALFAEAPAETHLDALRLSIPIMADRERAIASVLALYKAERTYAAWRLTEIMGARAYPDKSRAMLDETWDLLMRQRNLKWLDVLIDALKEGDVIVAVGALHLPTDDGLLTALEREGFTVTPLGE